MDEGKEATVRVLGIAGSPRRRGNTERLLDRFLAGAEEAGAEVGKVAVARLRIAGCVACDGCWEDGLCVVQDDFQDLHRKLLDADVIALAAPLYFWSLPAQVKAVVDRGQCQWARKYILKAPVQPTGAGRSRRWGVFISAGGEAEPDFTGALKTVRGFFGVYGAAYWGELLVGGVDGRGEVLGRPEALQQAFDLGKRVVAAVRAAGAG